MKTHTHAPISQSQLLTLVASLIHGHTGREDDEHPLPKGPWGPVIREALSHSFAAYPSTPTNYALSYPGHFGRDSESWLTFLAYLNPLIWELVKGGPAGPGRRSLSLVAEPAALNPQPLPPRIVFISALAQVVIQRAELLHELATASTTERQISVSGGYIGRFIDDACGNDFWEYLKLFLAWWFNQHRPIPWPGPQPDWNQRSIDLIVLATQFQQAALQSFSSELGRELHVASGKLLEAGIAHIPTTD